MKENNTPYAPERSRNIVRLLKEIYPEAECALRYDGEPWKLLIMAILSAQCTDARVNIVSDKLFKVLPSVESAADAPVEAIEELIKSCGLYKNKAKNIKASCIMLRDAFDCQVPDDLDELLKLPIIVLKIANLIVGDIFGKPAIVTDTHCIRLSEHLGLVPEGLSDPRKIENILKAEIEPAEQSNFCHRLVFFGRDCCTARSPKCVGCRLSQDCRKRLAEAAE